MYLKWLLRALPYLLCMGLGFAGCWHFSSDTVCPVQVGKVSQSQTTTVDHVITKTVKPDGTTIVRQEEKQSERDKTATQVVPTPVKSKYSLGLDYLPSLSTAPSLRDTRIEAAARLGDSNLWGVGGYDIKDKQISLGLRYEW